MTEHNGSTDVFKSDKGVWRAHPPSLSLPPLSISLSISRSPVDVRTRATCPGEVSVISRRSRYGEFAARFPSPSHSRFPPFPPPPSFFYPFFFPLFSFSFSSGTTSGTRAPHGCAFAYDLPAGFRLADSEREREREREREGGREGRRNITDS